MTTPLRIADRWFERKSFDAGITWLTETHVHRLLRCNIWHVRGRERDLLVDTGLGVASLRDEIADLVDGPITAVATHVHYDHAGSLHEFEDRRIHRSEVDQMADYKEFAFLCRDDIPDMLLASLAATGMPVEGDYLVTAAPSADFDPAAYGVGCPASATAEALDAGDIIDLGDRHFEVLHLPGHTPGSIGLWEETTGTLFSGDAVYDDGPLLDQLPESDIQAYVDTMKRLRDFPVTVVHAGHEKSFGRERLRELADGYLAVRDGRGRSRPVS
jgi:glyoxylase-like metal-dependent hydrolase (beta-lactamase superfamily II)